MPIEYTPIPGWRFQCDRCPDVATKPARDIRTLRAINPGWTAPEPGASGPTLCPACSGCEPRRHLSGKTLRETLGVHLWEPFDQFTFWRAAEAVNGGDNLTAADVLRMRFTFGGEVRQTYADIGAALGVSGTRARALVLRAVYRVRAVMRRGEK